MEEKICYISRRSYEENKIDLVLNTAQPWTERDSGWQLLTSKDSGYELSNPSNSLLISVEKAIEKFPRLQQILSDPAPQEPIAYRWEKDKQSFERIPFPEDYPTAY